MAEALGAQVGWDGNIDTVTISSSAATPQYYFLRAGEYPDQQALDNLTNSANSTLDIAIYSLTKDDIVSAIVAAKNRGVGVRLITDKGELQTKSQCQALSDLTAAGIPVKNNTHSSLMHLKVTIADDKTLTISYNYSNEATYWK